MTLKYACTALHGTNKGGILKPDDNGYYRLCLGAFNIYNSANIWYNHEASKHVFESSSSFMRRMSTGNLYSEEDHPQWVEGTPLQSYIARIKKIEPKNICAHIRDVEIVEGPTGPDGTPMMLIYGSVKPDRERGQYLKAALDNPDQNVCFSLRALCDDQYVNGRLERTITDLITFDWVVEPGLHVAHKYNAPGLECYIASSSVEVAVPLHIIHKLVNEATSGKSVGLESHDISDFRQVIKYYESCQKFERPKSLDW